jgi:dolichol-phosphate mannosyltransferase
VYNEQDNVVMFYDRVKNVINTLQDSYDCELLFTNNRSVDNTLNILRYLHEQDPRVKVLTLSRNFGYQASVQCGLSYAVGDASVVIDADCEDPPEMLLEFVKLWEQGYDVVYGIRKKRPEPAVVQWMRNIFYLLLQSTGDNPVILNMAEFALIDRQVRNEILRNKSTFPFLRTEIGFAGFNRMGIPYERQARKFGKTHYNFFGMTAFAIGGILTSSTYLLRMSAFLGGALLLLNVILLAMDMSGIAPKALDLLIGLDLMYLVFFLAVLSVYNARIYHNTAQRPVFIVDWKLSTLPNPTQASVSQKAEILS